MSRSHLFHLDGAFRCPTRSRLAAWGLALGLGLLPLPGARATGLTPARARPAADERHHVVQPGETVGGISRRYGVSVQQLRSWNRRGIGPGDRIRAGTRLRIRRVGRAVASGAADVERRGRTWQIYEVQPGDTLVSAATTLGLTANELRLANRLGRNARLKAGQRLQHRRPLPSGGDDSASVGRPGSGRLEDGYLLPEGHRLLGYVRRFPENAWATWETVRHVQQCAAEIKRRYPRSVPLVVGDISRLGGGRLKPHVTHQSGRDVDLGYYLKRNRFSLQLRVVGAPEVDAEKTWALVRCLIDTGEVRRILIDHGIQRALREQAEHSVREAQLDEWFQYPADKRTRRGLIRHSPGHASHLHVQFACPAGDARCELGRL